MKLKIMWNCTGDMTIRSITNTQLQNYVQDTARVRTDIGMLFFQDVPELAKTKFQGFPGL